MYFSQSNGNIKIRFLIFFSFHGRLMVGSPKATDPDIGIQSGALYYCESTFNSLSNCKIISITRGIESSKYIQLFQLFIHMD